ncbi:MAG TPA: 4a-hydroxytetrahydrobiopterin dehydratase [Candidatus Omnitrophota bacterium]|nr:4a-hydroxytetrahydrobiopterin dehydratase [Candidatus Omnitrophota bacterium]
MPEKTDLLQRHCVPCEGIGKALTLQEAQDYLKKIDFWQLDPSGKLIRRDYVLKNFLAGIQLMSKIAQVAEEENHHPDLHLRGYRKLRVELTTHALGGLSENDFILAAKINQLPAELKI